MGGGCIRARVGPDCSPGTAAAPHFTPCVQKYLFPFSGRQETLGGLLSERPLVVSMWEEAGLGSKQGGRGQGCREGGLGAKQRAEEVGEGGRNAEREEELQVDKNAALGLMLGIVLPALTPIVLSLAGAYELVRMDR